MSDVTQASIIKVDNKHLVDLKLSHNYYYMVDRKSSEWAIVLLESNEQAQKSLTKTLSSNHNTIAVYVAWNDFFWEISVFNEGKQISNFKYDIESGKAKAQSLENLLAFTSHIEECHEFINAANGMVFGLYPEAPLELLFIKAFGFGQLSNLHYYKINSAEKDINHVTKAAKSPNFKSVLLDCVEPYLNQKGFNYAGPKEDKTEHDFIKIDDNGDKHVITFSNHTKGSLIVQYNMFRTYEIWGLFYFPSMEELRAILINFCNKELIKRMRNLGK